MEIYIKIGTHSGQVVHVCNKRVWPELGEKIKIKEKNVPWIKSETVIIDEIVGPGGNRAMRTTFFASRV
jgi:NAD(P)H-hydrate repair Nnr-like enzyme with NAD(P)H-hydrate epimerase domain